MSNLKTLTNAVILTLDGEDTHFEQGSIIIADNLIKQIGPAAEIEPEGEIYDFAGKLLLPGLINTHTHSASPLFRSMADDLALMDWLKQAIWPAEQKMTGTMAYYGAVLSCLEFLSAGVTTFVDQYFFAERVFQAVQESGLRAVITPTVFSWPSPESENVILRVEKFLDKYGPQPTSRISTGIGPHAPYSVEAEDWEKVMALAEQYDLLIHTHISETRDENREIADKYGLSPTEWLDQLGVFNYPVLAAHSIHLSSADLDIYQANDVAVTYNPVSNLKLVSGLMPLQEMLARNITVSIGTDGAQSNNSLDLLRDLKTGFLIQKNLNHDAEFLPAGQALRMATTEGAKAIGMADKIGSLETGKEADIIALDLSCPNLIPAHTGRVDNLYSLVVYSASGSNVSDVLVGGEFLYTDYEPEYIEANAVKQEVNKIAKFLMAD
ncbi:MAG: amidohydrolase family protein [Bacillota bacterium]